MIWRRRARHTEEHAKISRRLDQEEQAVEQMKKRVRLLEIEAGIYNPNLREVETQ